MTHLKLACGAAAILALAVTFAVGRTVIKAPPVAAASSFDDTWWDNQATLKKADRLRIIPLTKPVETVKLEPAPPPPPPEEPKKPKEERKVRVAEAERNVCTRHGLRKVWINNNRWRCRR